jgi:hypothetical protein
MEVSFESTSVTLVMFFILDSACELGQYIQRRRRAISDILETGS